MSDPVADPGPAPDGRRRAARRLWQLTEPLHAVTYFSPEPLAALRAAGYRGFWMGYFAGRAAPLGPASAELVHAVFANFAFDHVARALPAAWDFAPPQDALTARLDGSVAALTRQFGDLADGPGLVRAADLLARVSAAAPLQGRPLFAANRALPEPAQPLARLWHHATLLREHRGDGHLAVLTAHGLAGRGSHVLHALHTGTPQSTYAQARNLDEAEWDRLLTGLRSRGLVDGHTLSPAGRALRQSIEDTTDELAAQALTGLTDDELAELAALLLPLTRAVVEAGDIPVQSPMGLNLRDVLDQA